ncbi:MAG: 8-amino-7-oxononanoate synthase [Phenylobacterium sp.]|uniref:8-amino-7-oxononanoate synthase n=1 Tax=Phenylobacterium sp. TaxID=1871053 RepID=UPI001B67F510|nr:8-amino-7-oxononanoate synthase [Phenylobacterium sp.]MBP7815363.1 8-amino-7-oxononanoate synthase [Phenylobacterium sp.]MBP9230899.1 8-amino-7-oxononanoate synthase [Phenylobacterium sp.]MBP9753717.1 8-amino-7-oxononanoate synthase [Phenylobacterium sp.]
MTDSLTAFAAEKLDQLESRSLRRRLVPTDRIDGLWVERGGRRLVSFSCNDYLNLSHHPAVKAAAMAAVERYGAGAGASRLVTGDHPIFGELEARLAALKGKQAACVFGSGYLANTGIIPTVMGPGDLILADELAHACIWSGAQLSGATVLAFRHNDMADLAEKLAAHRGAAARCLIATDGVFSMDGDLAPLDAISSLARANHAWLLVDDAHGLGVVGEGGAGSGSVYPGAHIDLSMGTFSKALGGYGAYVCASAPVIDLIKTRARTFVYTTGLPPANAAAALAALDVIAAEPSLVGRPSANARRFTRALNLPEATSAVVPILMGEADRALAAARALESKGFLAVAIRPPTVPAGTARLRLAFTAGHTTRDIDGLISAMVGLLP